MATGRCFSPFRAARRSALLLWAMTGSANRAEFIPLSILAAGTKSSEQFSGSGSKTPDFFIPLLLAAVTLLIMNLSLKSEIPIGRRD